MKKACFPLFFTRLLRVAARATGGTVLCGPAAGSEGDRSLYKSR